MDLFANNTILVELSFSSKLQAFYFKIAAQQLTLEKINMAEKPTAEE
ncbi:hypothetical protein KUC_1886 [Vreelandella boliviensis LC1]|uniref:Uncharacterized protein n=1 Tax=Vreelandella boliviensis LC1 TaxID=1072583 RepID=A0A7U9GII0_9GAMM|nr:hypothetical protein KUC_1886 [Halomonas boliviensis LC1]